jgi:hypothetical protein
MKPNYLLGPFWDLKFCSFSLLKIKTGWVFRFVNSRKLWIKINSCPLLCINLNFTTAWHPTCLNLLQGEDPPSRKWKILSNFCSLLEKTWTCQKYCYIQPYFYVFILNKYTCATLKEVQFKFFCCIQTFPLENWQTSFYFFCLKNTPLVQYIDKPLTQLSILALMSPAGPLHSGEKRFMKRHLAFSRSF